MVVRRVYDQILAAYKEQPRVSGIYFCTPQSERRSLNFFPGHRGFSGDDIVIGGVIIVGHNFSNLSTWKEHINIDEQETDRTWGNLRKYFSIMSSIRASGSRMQSTEFATSRV